MLSGFAYTHDWNEDCQNSFVTRQSQCHEIVGPVIMSSQELVVLRANKEVYKLKWPIGYLFHADVFCDLYQLALDI